MRRHKEKNARGGVEKLCQDKPTKTYEWIDENYKELIKIIGDQEIDEKLDIISGIYLSIDSIMNTFSDIEVRVQKLGLPEVNDFRENGLQT